MEDSQTLLAAWLRGLAQYGRTKRDGTGWRVPCPLAGSHKAGAQVAHLAHNPRGVAYYCHGGHGGAAVEVARLLRLSLFAR